MTVVIRLREKQKRLKNVEEAKKELKEAEADAEIQQQKAATAEEWKAFKREFNHDMDEFGKTFRDLTIDNKK